VIVEFGLAGMAHRSDEVKLREVSAASAIRLRFPTNLAEVNGNVGAAAMVTNQGRRRPHLVAADS
jgi:hypothetical protein